MAELTEWPTWLRDVRATIAAWPQYVLWGNVNDMHMLPVGPRGQSIPVDTVGALWEGLKAEDYEFLIAHHPVSGLQVLPPGSAAAQEAANKINLTPGRPLEIQELRDLAESITDSSRAGALLLHRPTRSMTNVDSPTAEEQAFFAAMEGLAVTSTAQQRTSGRRCFNPVIWVIDRERDLPHWLLSDNPARIRSVVVPQPGLEQRRQMAEFTAPELPSASGADAIAVAAEDLAEGTDGMTLLDIETVKDLARDQKIAANDVETAIRTHRLGVSENPWRRDYLKDAIRRAEKDGTVSNRVLGQPAAVTKAFDILKRSVEGLSGAQARSSSRRPRGVLMFVGPTGVGKTELAKALTELIFGEGVTPLRFDMSEFRADHSEARLIGAPPGYVGYDAGGELTNALRRRPFSLVLFDEIDKAHPRILDKFLQVLDEGRLTDGRGSTVSFEETLLIFTSNAGMDAVNEEIRAKGSGLPALPEFEELESRLRSTIKDFFIRDLQRPELLNRFGDNIVVFDFIRPPVPRAIFDGQVRSIVEKVAENRGVTVTFEPRVLDSIAEACTNDPLMGGRGIGNLIESLLINPLSRALFELDPKRGSRLHVRGWSSAEGIAALDAVVRPR